MHFFGYKLSSNLAESDVRMLLRTDRLRAARERKGYTQHELANLCNIGIKQINRYENGVTEPNATTLTLIAHYLDVSIDYLCGLSDIPNNYPSLDLRPDERKLLEAYSAGDMAALVRLASERLRVLEGENS